MSDVNTNQAAILQTTIPDNTQKTTHPMFATGEYLWK